MDASGTLHPRAASAAPVDLRGTDLCPDCIERDDVHVAGYPRPGRRGRIRVCMGCGGTTRVASQKIDVVKWFVSTQRRES